YLSNKDNSELTISYTNTNLDMNQSDSFEYSVYSDLYGYSSKATVKLVFPENEAPVIDAGSDQTVTIGEDGTVTVNLAGSLVKNDGYPSWPLEKTWASQGDVTFGNPNAFETTARISSCGSHYIYLNVDDGLAESQDYVVINVKPRQVDEFYAPTASAGAYYGGASASDGQTLVVGARNEGAVYVYTRNSLDWDYVTTLLSPNAASNFGSSVAVDNNRIVVGISDTTANEVYVYNLNGTNWETSPYVITPSESAEYFGYSIDIDGDTIVVGANHDDNQKGSAYVFDFDGTDWNQTHKLTASDGLDTFYDGGRSYGDQFGICVGIDSDLIVVGASEADTNNIHRTGKAYLFQNIVGSWSQVRDFVPSDGVEYGRFGYSLAISGQTICIGSYKANVGALSKAGKVYVYTLSGSIWDEDIITASSPGACDYFGVSIDIESDTLAVGAHGDDVGGINSGNVYVFARNNDSWTETEYNLPNSSAGDNYGISVALAGDVLFAGARHSSGAISDSGSMARILLIDGPHIPFINNILLDVDQNHPVDFTLVQDADSTGWTYHVIGLPEHGLLSGDAPELTFLADSDYQGLDVITFRAFNGYYYSNEAIVDINIAIPGQNKAPVIDAGGDHSETSEESPIIGTMDVTLPNPAFLEGTASDDDLPRGILNYQWTVVSAPVGVEPSEVEFDRPNTLDPLAFLPEVGVYELCLTVDDNKLSSSDTIRITVFPKVEFSASNNHLMVKLGTDKIWSCGNNSAGGDSLEKLGRSGITSLLLPVENGAMQTESDYLEGIKQVEGAAHHSVALDTAGDVWTWGCNATQELGMACYSDWEESRATQTRPDYVAYEP
ncbi:hypothetical protein KAR91_32100, partial [Candidatus Pacearchaeota archaeon]|nr:hypothetical protein [Candidatus Pacearchaeota archaeon]